MSSMSVSSPTRLEEVLFILSQIDGRGHDSTVRVGRACLFCCQTCVYVCCVAVLAADLMVIFLVFVGGEQQHAAGLLFAVCVFQQAVSGNP